MPQRRLVPDVVHDQDVVTASPQELVTGAVKRMVEREISAVVITADGTTLSRILGIFTERDLTVRVVGAGRDPRRTRLSEVMTRDPDTLPPEARALEALQFMRKRHYRHLPVVEDGRVVGMVSIRDLFAVATEQLVQDVHECEAIVFGSGYSVDTIVDRPH
jgi:CBS domain-containing protein